MTVIDRELLRRLPKAELHCHLDGSVRPQTLIELGDAYGRPMPVRDPAALAEYMRVDDARHLEDYLARFEITLSVMQTAEALERITYELVEDAFHDGVRYIEVRYAPVLNTMERLSMGDAIEATLRGAQRAERDTGTIARVIVCALRNQEPSIAIAQAEVAAHYKGRGVVGFDLAGGEEGNPASRFEEAFALARRHDLCCTCHAGEGAGAESVADTLHHICPERLGHATHLVDDPRLVDEVYRTRVALECCITSNVQTRAIDAPAQHPVRTYLERDLNVTLSTDNRLMSHVTLTDEYDVAARSLGLSFDQLSTLALNGFRSAFLPAAERDRLLEIAERDIRALRGAIA
ncbi:MAG TPA: adenosine deaminase [Gemmatimonadaceae bacterium]